MSDFRGQIAVVTGAANGIGAAVAEELHSRGASVIGLDREPLANSRITQVQVDLADAEAVTQAAKQVLDKHQRVDVLVNVAGVCPVNLLADLDLRLFDLTLAVNLRAPVLLMQILGSAMAEVEAGRIVNVSSVHGRFSEPGAIGYDASKGGLEAATRTAALELADGGVLVNAVAPGFVNTRMSIVDGKNELESDWFNDIYRDRARLPLRRPAEPSEIAQTVVWLASRANTYVTGQVVGVDGGLSVRF